MPEIKYVVISDFHLGAENSLMTNLVDNSYATDNSKASPVMIKLVECLKEVIFKNPNKTKPKLIFNGDLIELALTTANQAAMAFQRFIELTMPDDHPEEWLFDKEMLLIPGNHDHSLWETARYHTFIEELKKLSPCENIIESIHTTTLFDPVRIDSLYLTSLAQVYPNLKAQKVHVRTVYPGHAYINDKKDKCLIISHGHFIESMYSLMSTLDELIFPDRIGPTLLSDLEAQNYAWIDFFWSTLGRSGGVGKDISLVYDKMQDPNEVTRMVDSFVNSITSHQHNIFKAWLEKGVLEGVLNAIVGKLTKNARSQPGILDNDSLKGLHKYLEVFIRNQLEFELNTQLPADITFLFGHTHKPFEQDMNFEGYPADIKVYNSGGWVVDTEVEMPFHGGSILLVDENLNTAALQMYKEGKYNPTIEVSGQNQVLDKNPLYDWLLENINFNDKIWQEFSLKVEEEVRLRYKYLKEIIKSND